VNRRGKQSLFVRRIARFNNQVNPPADPGSGNARGLINSRYWDPLQRGGQP